MRAMPAFNIVRNKFVQLKDRREVERRGATTR
jgi:hypothetical protein